MNKYNQETLFERADALYDEACAYLEHRGFGDAAGVYTPLEVLAAIEILEIAKGELAHEEHEAAESADPPIAWDRDLREQLSELQSDAARLSAVARIEDSMSVDDVFLRLPLPHHCGNSACPLDGRLGEDYADTTDAQIRELLQRLLRSPQGMVAQDTHTAHLRSLLKEATTGFDLYPQGIVVRANKNPHLN